MLQTVALMNKMPVIVRDGDIREKVDGFALGQHNGAPRITPHPWMVLGYSKCTYKDTDGKDRPHMHPAQTGPNRKMISKFNNLDTAGWCGHCLMMLHLKHSPQSYCYAELQNAKSQKCYEVRGTCTKSSAGACEGEKCKVTFSPERSHMEV